MGWESDMRVAAQVGAEVEPEMDKCQIVRGVVERLQIAKGYEDFAFTQETKDAAGVLAVGAAAMGQAVNSTGLLVSSGGSAIDMQFYTCLVDGKRVVGRFHRVGFKDGDEVEFVCEQSGDNYAVAARDPNSRVIWTLPYHERGEQAQRRNAMKWMWIIAIAMGIFVTIFCWHITLSDPHDAPLWFFPVNFFVGIAIWLVIEYPVIKVFSRYGKAATPIFDALGFENPADVDLVKIDRAVRKASASSAQRAPLPELWTYRY